MKKRVIKRFAAFLLLFCIVFANVGLDNFYAQTGNPEEMSESVQEDTESVGDEEEIAIDTEAVDGTETVPEDTESVNTTEEIEATEEIIPEETESEEEVIPEDTEEIIPEDTEEIIPEETEEAEVEENFTWKQTTAERNLYYDAWAREHKGKIYLGETLDELFQMYNDPSIEMADWEDFFAGTCFEGTTLDGLKWLQENGYSMDELIQTASDNGMDNVWNMLAGVETTASYKSKTVSFTGNTVTVQIPAIGKHDAPVYTMKMGGRVAFCGDCGKHMTSSTVLAYAGEVNTSYIKKAMAYADTGGNYALAQLFIWAGGNKDTYCTAYAQYYYSRFNSSASYEDVQNVGKSNPMFGQAYHLAESNYDTINGTSISGVSVYLYSNGNSSYQRIYAMFRDEEEVIPPDPGPTPDPEPTAPAYAEVTASAEVTVEANATLNVSKRDDATGQGLGNVKFNFYKDGSFEGSATTDSNGNVSFSFTSSYYASSSSTKTYCSNYADLTDEMKATVTGYKTYDEAYNAAYNEAYAQALSQANSAKSSTSHNYTATEVTARNGYWLNPANTTVGQSAAGDASLSVVKSNKRTTGSITITKEDSETGATAQGDATLTGATYGLYARNDIVHPDGHTGTLYKAGTLVATFPATGADHKATLNNLYLGNYYVKELTPSTGYLLDTKEYDVQITYEGQDVRNVVRTKTVTEDVIKGNIRLVKHLQERNPSDASKPQVPEQGAEFDIILKSSGVTYAHIVTDADGFAQANLLPYGNYIVRQTKGKDGYAFIDDFEVFIRAHERTYTYILENLDYMAQLQIVKKDKETGEIVKIAGAKFEVYDEKANKIVQKVLYPTKYEISVFETDENGMLELPEWLGSGKYYLKEVQAPEGYVLNSNWIPFTISRDKEVKDEWGDSVIQVSCEDVSVKGIIEVTKTAALLSGYEDGKFIYSDGRVKDAQYQIVAAEDIYRADRQTDAEGNLLTVYKKGDVVETITTDQVGYVASSQLPLGKYTVKEISVPGGVYLDQKEINVELKYENDRTEVVFAAADFYDQRQEIEISAYKYDTKTSNPIPGVELSLYANTDILDYQGNVILKKGTLIRQIETDRYGKAAFGNDLPLNVYAKEADGSMYYIRETKFPAGYIPEDNIYFVDSKTPDMTVQFIKENVNVTNVHVDGIIKVTKIAPVLTSFDENGRFVYTKERIHDAKYQIIAAEDIYRADCELADDGKLIPIYKKGEVIQTITTDQDGYAESAKLPLGKYTVKEIYVPEGIYLEKESVDVELKYADDNTEIVYENADFYDNRQELKINVLKYDQMTDERIEGVEVSLYANKDIVDYYGNLLVAKGTLIRKGVTDNRGRYVFSTDIPLDAYAKSEDGQEEEPMYYLVESRFPSGYVTNGKVYYIDSKTPEMTIQMTEENVNISNEPLIAKLDVDKNGQEYASPGGLLRYTVYTVTNQCKYSMDNFTLTDTLPEHVKLGMIYTGSFKDPTSKVINYSIWYKTNMNSEWRAWRLDLESNDAKTLYVDELGLQESEYVTEFQYRFGTVPAYFQVDAMPYYDVTVDQDVDMDTVLVNHIKLAGNKFGKYLTAEDQTETRLLYGKITASINGKNGNGGWTVSTTGAPKTDDKDISAWFMLFVAGVGVCTAGVYSLNKKKKRKKINAAKIGMFAVFMLISVFGFSKNTYAADMTVTKEAQYTTNDSSDLHSDFEDKIIEGDTFYKLKDVDYEVLDKSQVIVDKTVVSDLMLATDEYEPEKTITDDNLAYKLVDTKKLEDETVKQLVAGFDDYDRQITEADVPQTKTVTVEDLRTGEEMEVECPLSGIEMLSEGTPTTDTISITFEGYNLGVFEWNGNYVRADAEYPLKGYEKQLLASVGLSPSIYTVNSIQWDGDSYVNENGVTCRNAVAEVQHYGYLYRANYETEVDYVKYEASYENVENDNFNYVIRATATYQQIIPVTQIIIYAGIGILLLCILIVLVIYIVAKKKKSKDKEEKENE